MPFRARGDRDRCGLHYLLPARGCINFGGYGQAVTRSGEKDLGGYTASLRRVGLTHFSKFGRPKWPICVRVVAAYQVRRAYQSGRMCAVLG